jgi:hypothetical protein
MHLDLPIASCADSREVAMMYTAAMVFGQEDSLLTVSRACIIHAMNMLAQDIKLDHKYIVELSYEINDLVTDDEKKVYVSKVHVGDYE